MAHIGERGVNVRKIVTAHGSTVSNNGKEPGIQDGWSKAIPGEEIYGAICTWTIGVGMAL